MRSKFKLSIGNDGKKKVVNLYFAGNRYRYYNARAVGIDISTAEDAQLVKAAFDLKLREGWTPPLRDLRVVHKPTFKETINERLLKIQASDYSNTYKRDVFRIYKLWEEFEKSKGISHISCEDVSVDMIEEFIVRPKWTPSSQKVVKGTLSALVSPEIKVLVWKVKLKRAKSKLHKPIKNIDDLLEEVFQYNLNLYIVCMLVYGCLLRPHIECRLLCWRDIDFEKNIISLSGKHNKSGRNRIVPLPKRIKSALLPRIDNRDVNVLSGKKEPYNASYLGTLWNRYKEYSKYDLSEVTLYSLRHSSAIHVFEKTGSLLKLQQVLGHSSMTVSLTYLRGLEIQQLDVNDLPDL